MLQKVFIGIKQHKIITFLIIIAIGGAGFFGYKKIKGNTTETRYVLSTVGKGNIIVSVSGSGQISSLDQVTIKPKVSGDITYINFKNGQSVKTGTLLAQIDTTDAQDAIDNAKETLAQEQLTLDKMNGLTTNSGTIRGDKEKAEDTLAKAYEDGFNNVSNVFLALPNLMTGLNNILFSASFSSVQYNINYYADSVKNYDEKVLQYQADADSKYRTARTAYDKSFEDYKAASRFSDTKTIESLITETYETVKDVSEAIKSTNNLIQFYQDKLTEHNMTPQTLSTTHLSTLNTYTGNTNGYLSNLLSSKTAIQLDKEAIIQVGFDIQDQELKVAKTKRTLQDAQDQLINYSIYAPFDGTITEVQEVKKGDSVSSGTTLATLITKQQIAEISLNEVDVSKVKTDQKVIITFDALSDLTISGKVYEVDTLGSASQGVVSYGVKIVLDTQNENVKPGMSITASIITDLKQDILAILSSAIKTSNGNSYVEIANSSAVDDSQLNNNAGVVLNILPTQQEVTTGLSDDTSTEILSGLKEGDIIVTKTITSSTTKTTSTSSTTNTSTQRGLLQMGGDGPRD